MVITLRDFHRYHPLRALDWRWQCAQQLAADGRRSQLDPETTAAVDYLRAGHRCSDDRTRAGLATTWPALAAAHQLAENDGPLRWEVEARLLARQTDAEIAQACQLAPQNVAWFESLFFHVRDRLDSLDWIASKIGHGAILPGDLRRIWRYFGYHAGVLVLETIIAVSLSRPLPASISGTFVKNPPLEEQRWRAAAKLSIAALTLPSADGAKTVLQLYKAKCALDRQLGLKRTNAISLRWLKLMLKSLTWTGAKPGRKSRSVECERDPLLGTAYQADERAQAIAQNDGNGQPRQTQEGHARLQPSLPSTEVKLSRSEVRLRRRTLAALQKLQRARAGEARRVMGRIRKPRSAST
jgi:hypothetical protein